ncbi:MAG TPA: copper resistance protein CopC [Baekduia sp.]|uniref:copper resistance CopC family protein n=1 Tax=Baekduia sp. TaxID=2600305 RepID=UPI002D78D1C4|nr:copper resistance protein CopC [Baekduia sp.]HET6510296.1 copper resistance protein CopC [Baekduia sp.]
MFKPSRPVAALAVAGALALAATAAPAFAHAPVKSRTPAPGTTRGDVKRVAVTFGEAVLAGKIAVTKDGKAVRATSSGLNAKKTVLSASFAKKLAAGRYKVSWRVRADDGDSETGSWTFTAR